MNANELADELDRISYDCTLEEWQASPVGGAATMLRQQQAEIEALKNEIMDWINDSPYNIITDEYFKTILRKAQKNG